MTRLRLIVLPVSMGSGAIGGMLGRSDATRWLGLVIVASCAAAFVASSPRRPYRARAWSMISIVLVVSASGFFFVGLSPGPVLAVTFCLVMTALLLGRAVLTFVLVLTGTMGFALTGAIALGLWSGPPLVEVDMRDPVIWAREMMISVLCWGGISFSVLFVMNAIERTSERRKVALDEKDEALQRLESESRARREAEAIAAQSQKLDALGQFAAGVAHDFNNALLVVKAWTEILGEANSSELQEEGLEAIDQATEQAGQLARQLLTFGRKEVRSPRYLRLDDLVSRTARTLRRVLPSTIDLNVDAQSHDAAVYADETQLQQLLFNLVINARDAIDTNGEIHVRTRCVGDPDTADGLGWALLEVADDGEGMDEETRSHAFEPFFTTKEVGKSTGLGLSTVFGIVEQSQGRLEIESTPRIGTRVTVSLPRVELAVDDRVPEVGRLAPSHDNTARVLVLEDDPLAHDLIVFSLERGGFEVLDASDGTAAVRLLEEAGPSIDILCTDAVFPGSTLTQVIEAFKAASPHGRVVICSGYVREEIAIHGAEAGIYDFLAKPFTGRELVEKIESMGRG